MSSIVRGATSSSFQGGAIFMNFHSMTSSCFYSIVIQLFRKRSQIKFSSQHFRKWALFSFNQARN